MLLDLFIFELFPIFKSKRRSLVFFIDVFLIIFSLLAAFLLRFEGEIPHETYLLFKVYLPFTILIRVFIFVYFGLYESLWRYIGLSDLLAICKSVTAGSGLLALAHFLFGIQLYPRSVFILDWLILIFSLSAVRVILKIFFQKIEEFNHQNKQNKQNIVVVGSGDVSELLIRESLKNPRLRYKVIGMVDNDPKKIGLRIHGVKVLADVSQLARAVHMTKAREVIIADPYLLGDQIRKVHRICREIHLDCRIVSPQFSILSLKPRPIGMSDLLKRELVEADMSNLKHFFCGKSILVTGAGGSIGSALSRALFQCAPKEIVVVDNSENNLYQISSELRLLNSDAVVHSYLINVSDYEAMDKIFFNHKPEVVYHAAAFKHVPMVEEHFCEGILNNVLGTKVVADLSREYGTSRFVLISTDKAVNPRSIMGTTKRIAELYVQSLKGGRTCFLTVRFGNVFNSQGSVISVFQRQIEAGGPIQVTHPAMKRFFMDVSEAVFLITQVTWVSSGSGIFVLDMGEPIKILDIARDLMELMDVPLNQIAIQFTGLRPGEKIEEDLVFQDEVESPTFHKKVKMLVGPDRRTVGVLDKVNEIVELARDRKGRAEVIQKLKEIVPEYDPWFSCEQAMEERFFK